MACFENAITIITPCYNEGQVVISFLDRLEVTLSPLLYSFSVVVVNDCSTDKTLTLLNGFHFRSDNLQLHIVNLPANVGHQAAIYQGFLFARSVPSGLFIVMDADGEDSPAIIPSLLTAGMSDIVHVVRSERSESLFFRSCYTVYKMLFKAVTGKQMNYGNFCLINRNVLEYAISDGFSHFPAWLAKQSLSKSYVVAAREKRLGGVSKMRFSSLCLHALSSFSEYRRGLKPQKAYWFLFFVMAGPASHDAFDVLLLFS